MTMDNIRKKEPSEELRQPRRNISRSSIMAIIIITALLTSLSVIVLTDSTTPKEKPIDVFGQSDDSVDAAPAQVYISDDNSDTNDGEAALRLTRQQSTTTMKKMKQTGMILNILGMQTITRW